MSERIKHPSYVTVGFSRIQGGVERLFGSALEDHHQMVALRICRATLEVEDSGHQHIYPEGRTICEVFLSPAQFAELLTTMNVYSGVPGTLRSWEEQEVPPPPAATTRSEASTLRDKFKADVRARVQRLDGALDRARDLVGSGKAPTKKQLAELLSDVERYAEQVKSDVPWLLSEFYKATEKVVTSAKAEIDALALSEIVQAGIALAKQRLSVPTLNETTPAELWLLPDTSPNDKPKET